MPDDQKQQLTDVFAGVLENLAFMFGDPVSLDDIPLDFDAALKATIGFAGPRKGTLILAAPAGIADELAANILGIEPEDAETDEHSHDALGELMNITLGKLLTEMDGTTPVYDLTPPEVNQIDAEQWANLHVAPGTIAFLVDDNPVLLRLIAEPIADAA